MCGRYYIDISSEAYQNIVARILKLDANFDLNSYQVNEVFPCGNCLLLNAVDHQIKPVVMKWQLVIGKYKLVNVRSEEAHKKYLIKDLIDTKRCVVIASGFYEWDENKNKHYFVIEDQKIITKKELASKKIIYLAGIYNEVIDEKEVNNKHLEFAILTKAATSIVSNYHHREPIIISPSKVSAYLNNA